MASSTKETGPGSRKDHLDDAFGDHIWLKIVELRKLLSPLRIAHLIQQSV